jgi:hypothetical protein
MLKEGLADEDKGRLNGGKDLAIRYRWKGNA